MKKILLTSLTGLMAVSAASAFEMAPYASAKLEYSMSNITIKGDSLSMPFFDEVEPVTAHTIKNVVDWY